jgi:hypothetical protein
MVEVSINPINPIELALLEGGQGAASPISPATLVAEQKTQLSPIHSAANTTVASSIPTHNVPPSNHDLAAQTPPSFNHSTVVEEVRPPSIARSTPRRPRRVFFYDKNNEYFGFTNYSPYAVMYLGNVYPTSEHLFQSLKVRSITAVPVTPHILFTSLNIVLIL